MTLTLTMTSYVVENDTVALTVLEIPDIDTDIVSVALLEVTIAQELPKLGHLTLKYSRFDLMDDLRCC